MLNTKRYITEFIGINPGLTTHQEKLVSGLGGLTSIFTVLFITRQFVGDADTVLIVASMGASAVLLFAVPHGPLSQPWALCCGHIVSAIIGVTCYLLIEDIFLAAAIAVGLSITIMYYLRCIHPPGGATALTAVVAGADVHDLGYWFVIEPVLLNVVIMLVIALIFNNLFSWRGYPAGLSRHERTETERETTHESILNENDFKYALKQMNLYIDISHEDLETIFQLAKQHQCEECLTADDIKTGHSYSNGEYGEHWSVRKIVDESGDVDPDKDYVIYKIVAGEGRRGSAVISRREFAQWAKYEVFLNENSWQRVDVASQVS